MRWRQNETALKRDGVKMRGGILVRFHIYGFKRFQTRFSYVIDALLGAVRRVLTLGSYCAFYVRPSLAQETQRLCVVCSAPPSPPNSCAMDCEERRSEAGNVEGDAPPPAGNDSTAHGAAAGVAGSSGESVNQQAPPKQVGGPRISSMQWASRARDRPGGSAGRPLGRGEGC